MYNDNDNDRSREQSFLPEGVTRRHRHRDRILGHHHQDMGLDSLFTFIALNNRSFTQVYVEKLNFCVKDLSNRM